MPAATLAKQYGRYGYRKICELLEIEGRLINHKKVEHIWREEGLQLPARHKRRKRLYHHDASIIRLRAHFPNHVGSIDFVHDKLSNGRPEVARFCLNSSAGRDEWIAASVMLRAGLQAAC